jgi:hypothetical protein
MARGSVTGGRRSGGSTGGGGVTGGTGGSVKVIKPQSAAKRLEKNAAEKSRVETAKSGIWAKYGSDSVKSMKPAKVVKINSAPAKSADAAKKAADAKALKAANKKKK